MPYYTVLTTKLCEMHHFNIYLNLSEVLRVYAILLRIGDTGKPTKQARSHVATKEENTHYLPR